MEPIEFNSPTLAGGEPDAVLSVVQSRKLCGGGSYTELCETMLEHRLACSRVLLTHSCTAALEMACLLFDLGTGDEVIMPSFTFPSTANAVVLRGSTPVFIDVDPLTMNLDVNRIESAITKRTKAIVAVHYAGRVPDIRKIAQIAKKHDLLILEDAAQSLGSSYHNEPAGTHGDLAAISFHETKNVIAGEGGALVINNPRFLERAIIIREKGTNRQQFIDGLVDKYTWMDLGSSYLPSELIAAFLSRQLEQCDEISRKRRDIWIAYRNGLATPDMADLLTVPASEEKGVVVNGHLFHILLPSGADRGEFISSMKKQGIGCSFHYSPLHSSPAGSKFGTAPDGCRVTEDCAARLVRLPLHLGLEPSHVERIIETTRWAVGNMR